MFVRGKIDIKITGKTVIRGRYEIVGTQTV